MTHITRVFNPETRALVGVERRYAGQAGDAISTVLHFEYSQLDFLIGYNPYIQFGIYDDDGNPLVFGPAPTNPPEPVAPTLEDRVFFNGLTFAIPWSVTSRTKSMRVDYQLFFVKKGVDFDGRNVAQLKPTEVVMSAVDSIALKPSISCKGNRNPYKCPPFTPTGTEPNILGYINLFRQYALMTPLEQDLILPEFLDRFGVPYEPEEKDLIANPPAVVIKWHTYDGDMDGNVVLENVAALIDGRVPYYQLPFGKDKNTVPLLRGPIADGQSIKYSESDDGFVAYDIKGIYQYKGTCTKSELDQMSVSKTTLVGSPLANGDVYSCTEDYPYGLNEYGEVEIYRAGTNWVWSEQERFEPLTGDMDLRNYQLESKKIASWDELEDVAERSEKQYPAADLVKRALDEKVDDSQIVTQWDKYRPEADPVQIPSATLMKDRLDLKLDRTQLVNSWDSLAEDTIPSTKLSKDSLDAKVDDTQIVQVMDRVEDHIPSTKLMGEQLDLKTDKTMAIPDWDAAAAYGVNSTVMFNGTIFVSLMSGNVGVPPVDDQGALSDAWSMIQGGGSSSTEVAQRFYIAGDGKRKDFDITHNYGVRDVFVSIRDRATNRLVSTDVTLIRPGAVRIGFFQPPETGQGYYVSISPAVPTQPQPGEVLTMEVLRDTDTWVFNHDLHRLVTVQTFDQSGYEIYGEVKQELRGLDRVTVTFNHPHKGTMVVR